MAWRVDILRGAAQIRLVAVLHPAPLVPARTGLLDICIHSGHLRHFVETLVAGGSELNVSDNSKPAQAPMKDIQIKLWASLLPAEMLFVQERHAQIIAGREQHQIDFLRAAIGEHHAIGRKMPDIRFGLQITMRQAMQNLAIHDRV